MVYSHSSSVLYCNSPLIHCNCALDAQAYLVVYSHSSSLLYCNSPLIHCNCALHAQACLVVYSHSSSLLYCNSPLIHCNCALHAQACLVVYSHSSSLWYCNSPLIHCCSVSHTQACLVAFSYSSSLLLAITSRNSCSLASLFIYVNCMHMATRNTFSACLSIIYSISVTIESTIQKTYFVDDLFITSCHLGVVLIYTNTHITLYFMTFRLKYTLKEVPNLVWKMVIAHIILYNAIM